MPQYTPAINLADLDGTNGFQAIGGGFSLSHGDVNGDGLDDVIIGARDADTPNGHYSGAVYVIYGTTGVFSASYNLPALNAADGSTFLGPAPGMDLGADVASGDINGDGVADMVAGAVFSSSPGKFSGSAYVVFGNVSGLGQNFDLASLDGTNGFLLKGGSKYDFAGWSVGAGDVNGDGYDDAIIGAPSSYPNGHRSGTTYVVYGHAGSFAPSINLLRLDGTDGFKIEGPRGSGSGYSVASGGDINGDGIEDLIISAWYADSNGKRSGSAYVVFGRTDGFGGTLELSTINGTNGFRMDGNVAYEGAGYDVASAGDLNADGIDDLIVGTRGSSNGAGTCYVIYGKATPFDPTLQLASLDGTNGFSITQAHAGDAAGCFVAAAGDVNGDGFADLLLGAPFADPHGNNSGAAYVVFGQAGSFGASFSLAAIDGNNGFEIDGPSADQIAGIRVSGAGDVNGDGFADVEVFTNAHDPGVAYVVFGGMPDEAVTRTGTDIANTIHGSSFDDTLIGLGGNDTLIGHGGDDKLNGGDGDDVAYGGGGDDLLIGVDGNDQLFGDAGNDTFKGGLGDDTIDGGAGIDTVNYGPATAAVTVNLAKGTAKGADIGNDTLVSIENVSGGTAGDTLRGNSAANVIDGGAGDDGLFGAGGNDTLTGADGKDKLTGGMGADTLSGGSGSNRFIYNSADESSGAAHDTLLSFNTVRDRIDVVVAVTAVDNAVMHASISDASFDADLSAATSGGALGANHAVVVHADAGADAGQIFLVVDQNGIAGYQSGADLVMQLVTPGNLGALSTTNFV